LPSIEYIDLDVRVPAQLDGGLAASYTLAVVIQRQLHYQYTERSGMSFVFCFPAAGATVCYCMW
jgi:hypothetical protein